jgi:predicted metal-dependent hydrolase
MVESGVLPNRTGFMPLRLPSFLTRPPAPAKPRKVAETLPATVEFASVSLPLVIRRNPRAKRLIMRLAPGGTQLSITAPPKMSAKIILDFIERHKGWAESRLVGAAASVRVADGALLPFRGGSLRIAHAPGRRVSRLDDGAAEPVLQVGGDPQHLARRVLDVLKREARRDLQAAVDRHAAAVGLKPAALTLKDTKSRWGSCTADRRLAFSWRIVMAPPSVLDYLAAHEVAHFREMNHGPDFWALCRSLCPDMDHGRAWLKREGAGLHAIRFD